MRNRPYFLFASAAVCALFLSACETTSTHTHTTALPKYEAPLAKRDFQNVRTTAYTHTESDHLPYGSHNALGGQLHAATGAIRRAEYTPRAIAVSSDDQADYRRASYSGAALEKFSLKETKTTKLVKTKHGTKKVVVTSKPQIGSAAADWSRWPAGTVFPADLDRTSLSRGRLRVGPGRAEHDRSLHAVPRHDEFLGRSRGKHPDFAVGRSERKLAPLASAYGISPHSADGSRASGPGRCGGRVGLAHEIRATDFSFVRRLERGRRPVVNVIAQRSSWR